MKDYNDIKNQWNESKNLNIPQDGHELIIRKGNKIRVNQIWTKMILGITVLILIAFFIYVSAQKSTDAIFGLSLMIGSLILRIIIEFMYKFNTNKFKVLDNFNDFQTNLKKYWRQRLYINYIITPILFVLYIVGFVILLPLFKEALSEDFYNYIFYSSWVIFAFLAIFIGYGAIKELKDLKSLSTNLN